MKSLALILFVWTVAIAGIIYPSIWFLFLFIAIPWALSKPYPYR